MSTKNETTVTHVCFRIDGGWLADFARTRFDEGAWGRALTLLTDSLEGLTNDQAIAILKGEATLEGDSSDEHGIRYKELKKNGKLAKRMQERMEYMYGDMFRVGDAVWKPYAIVSGWNEEDYRFAQTFSSPYNLNGVSGSDRAKFGAFRSLFYADDPHADMLVRIPERFNDDSVISDVLCKRVIGLPPFWYKISTNEPVAAIDAFLKRKMLPMRGAFRNQFGDRYAKQDVAFEEVEAAEQAAKMDTELTTISPAGSFGDTADEKRQEKLSNEESRQLWIEVLEATEKYLGITGDETTSPYDLAELGEMFRIFEKGFDTLHRFIRGDEEWDRIQVVRDQFTAKREKLMGDKIRAQAEQHGGFIEIPLTVRVNGEKKPYTKQRTLRVPKNPFLYWCLRGNFKFEEHGHEQPVWELVAGSGWKMHNDDPFHTDWMLGAGVPLSETYDHEDDSFGNIVRNSSYDYRHILVREYTGHQFTTLTKGDKTYISGSVVFPKPNERVPPGSVAIVPHAGPEYQLAMESANIEDSFGNRGCIICEVGGKLAHLVVVGREFKCTVLMLPNALKMYWAGQRVCIDLEDGTISNPAI